MTKEETRLACLELAVSVNPPSEGRRIRAAAFVNFVGDDQIKLGCVKLAVKSHGGLARIGAERLLEEAQKYHEFVLPPRPKLEAASQRRGRRSRS